MHFKTQVPLFLLLFFFSCSEKQEGAGSEVPPKNEAHYLITHLGDTIPTGVPVPAVGERISPDSIARPRIIPLQQASKPIPAHTNVQPAGKPKVVVAPQELKKTTPGKNGIPLPDTLKAQKIVVPAFQSRPVTASRFQMRNNAITNIQYLAVEEGLSDHFLWSILEDSRGFLWIGDRYGTLNRYDGHSLTLFSSSESLLGHIHNLRSLLEDKEGNIWFGTQTGLGKYDGNHFTYYSNEQGFKYNGATVFLQDSRGRLWFGTSGFGAGYFNPSNDPGTFVHYTTKEGMSSDSVNAILEDSQGQLWFGTKGGGLSRFDGHTFTHYTRKEGLSSDIVLSLLESREGHLWIGTNGGGLSRFDGQVFTHYSTQEGLSSNSVMALIEDRRGRLWFTTNKRTVNCFDRETFAFYNEENGTNSGSGTAFLEDSYGNIWIGTLEGIHKLGVTEFRHFNKELLFIDISAINEGPRGNIWFGTYSSTEGVIRFDGRTFTSFVEDTKKQVGKEIWKFRFDDFRRFTSFAEDT